MAAEKKDKTQSLPVTCPTGGREFGVSFETVYIVKEQDLKDAAETLATFSATVAGAEGQRTSQVPDKPEDATLAQSVEQLIRKQLRRCS